MDRPSHSSSSVPKAWFEVGELSIATRSPDSSSPIRIAPRLSKFRASISAWKKRSIPSEHRGTNGGELMELGGVRPSVYKALSNRRYLPLERKFRVAETGFAGKLGGAGQDRRNSSRTRPDTRSNQFASPETMSSPLLSEPIVLTAPSLISGIDAVRSSWSCSPVVLPGSFILSPPLSFSPPFFLSCDFYSKFNRGTKFFTKEEGGGRGRKEVCSEKQESREYFLKTESFKEWKSIVQKKEKEKKKIRRGR